MNSAPKVPSVKGDFRGTTPSSTSTRVLLALMSVGAAYLLLNLLLLPYGRDQGVFAVGARTMIEGGALYRDVWDLKPPGIFYIYVLAQTVFGTSEVAIRLFEICWMLMLGGVYVLMTVRVLPLKASIPVLAIAAFHLLIGGFWNTAQTETFGTSFVALGILLGLSRPTLAARRLAVWALCAACFTVAGVLKPTLAVGIIISFIFVVLGEYRNYGFKGFFPPLIAFCGGTMIVLGATITQLHFSGALPDFLEAMFDLVPRYTELAHNSRSFGDIASRTLTGFSQYTFVLPGLAMLLWFGRFDRKLMNLSMQLILQVAVLLLGVSFQAKFYFYHFATAGLLASILAGWGMWLLLERISGRWWGTVVFAFLFGVIMITNSSGRDLMKDNVRRVQMLAGLQDPSLIEEKLYKVHTFDLAANRQTGEWLAQNAPSTNNDVLVFGFEPAIYQYSGLPHFTRFIFSVPIRANWWGEAARIELMSQFSNLPWAIVLQSSDRLPQMTGDERDSRQFVSEEMPELVRILKKEYQLAQSFGPLDIYILLKRN